MGAVQRAGLAGIEAFRGVVGVEQVQVADLRPLGTTDAEEPARGHAERRPLTRGHGDLGQLSRGGTGAGVQRPVGNRQGLGRIGDHRRNGAPLIGVGGGKGLRQGNLGCVDAGERGHCRAATQPFLSRCAA